MNTPNTGLPADENTEAAAPAAASEAAPAPAPANPPQSDNRRRLLRDLLSIPERDRTDAQWDEIIELEIQLAPGNRIAGSGNDRPHQGPGAHGGQGRPGGGQQQKKKQGQGQSRQGQGQGQGGGKRRSRGNKPAGGGAAG